MAEDALQLLLVEPAVPDGDGHLGHEPRQEEVDLLDRLHPVVEVVDLASALHLAADDKGLHLDALRAREVYVSLSLDGDPETQDAERPDALGRGTSERLAGAVDRLLAWNPCAAVPSRRRAGSRVPPVQLPHPMCASPGRKRQTPPTLSRVG